MRKLLLAGFLALSSCSAAPAFAQEQPQQCLPLVPMLIEAGAARAAGAKVSVFGADRASIGVEAIGALIGPPPRKLEVTTLLVVTHSDEAVVVLGEGERACFVIPMTAKNARIVELAITGEPA